RSPLTGIVFSMELTHEWSVLIPLAIAACVAQAVSILTLKRSILTEKVVRKGLHLTREYTVDPLEMLFVHDVMERDIISFRADTPLPEAAASFLDLNPEMRQRQNEQRLYPVIDEQDRLMGVVTRRTMLDAAMDPPEQDKTKTVLDVSKVDPIVGYEDMTLREIAYQLADHNISRLPVIERDEPHRVIGLISVMNVLKGRFIDLHEERDTERVLRLNQMLLPLNRVRTYFSHGPVNRDGK
ncbi:MAG: CBS domain-containing protein, partial [Sinobacteraceae bacterium]|nr:CBS domain-containing protein [Nevskiaceae bacterium]